MCGATNMNVDKCCKSPHVTTPHVLTLCHFIADMTILLKIIKTLAKEFLISDLKPHNVMILTTNYIYLCNQVLIPTIKLLCLIELLNNTITREK